MIRARRVGVGGGMKTPRTGCCWEGLWQPPPPTPPPPIHQHPVNLCSPSVDISFLSTSSVQLVAPTEGDERDLVGIQNDLKQWCFTFFFFFFFFCFKSHQLLVSEKVDKSKTRLCSMCVSVCAFVCVSVADHLKKNQWSENYQIWHGDCRRHETPSRAIYIDLGLHSRSQGSWSWKYEMFDYSTLHLFKQSSSSLLRRYSD